MARPKIQIPEAEVERMARLGMTQAQMARALGVSTDTFERRKAASEALRSALERGRARGVDLVAGALMEAALKGNVRAQIFYLKAHAGWSETTLRPFATPPHGQEKEEPKPVSEETRRKLERLIEGRARYLAEEMLRARGLPEDPGVPPAEPAEPAGRRTSPPAQASIIA